MHTKFNCLLTITNCLDYCNLMCVPMKMLSNLMCADENVI